MPSIIWQEFQILPTFPILWMRIGLLVGFIGLTFVWKVSRPLRTYFIIFLVLFLADALFNWIGTTSVWQGWFGNDASFSSNILNNQLLRLGVTFVMIAALLLIYRSTAAFFLTKGDLNAPAAPVH